MALGPPLGNWGIPFTLTTRVLVAPTEPGSPELEALSACKAGILLNVCYVRSKYLSDPGWFVPPDRDVRRIIGIVEVNDGWTSRPQGHGLGTEGQRPPDPIDQAREPESPAARRGQLPYMGGHSHG